MHIMHLSVTHGIRLETSVLCFICKHNCPVEPLIPLMIALQIQFSKQTHQKQTWYNHLLGYNLLTTLENSIMKRWVEPFFLSLGRSLPQTFTSCMFKIESSHKYCIFFASSLNCWSFTSAIKYCDFKETMSYPGLSVF